MIYAFPIALSAVMVTGIYVAVRCGLGIKAGWWIAGIGFVCTACIPIWPVVALQSFLTLIACGVCAAMGAKPRGVLISCVCAALVAYGLILVGTYRGVRQLALMRATFPLESISARLGYETKREAAAVQPDDTRAAVSLSPLVEKNLVRMETRLSSNTRDFVLELLHDRTVDSFIRARGFGVYRMINVLRKEYYKIPEPAPVVLADIPTSEPIYQPEMQRDGKEDGLPIDPLQELAVALPSRDELLSVHQSGLEDFLNRERMGYIRDRDHVAGFISHRFDRLPGPAADWPADGWQLTRLELVSLLKHDEPRAYVSRELPRMEVLVDAPTRPLEPFEERALARLRYDEDLVVDESINVIRMLGSVRAGTDCLECHQVERGKMLGAFSYELHRLRPIRKKPAVADQPPPPA